MGMEPNEDTANDNPDDGLAIVAVVLSAVICFVLGGLVWLSHLVGLL